jgi:hypothetical protein
MIRAEIPRAINLFGTAALCAAIGVGAAILAGGTITLVAPPAQATPAYASQTGLACGKCHVNPAGGGANTAFGKAFAANGHKVPK